MTATESQDIILYVPKSNVLTAVLVGICLLAAGLTMPFLIGWQLSSFLISLFFFIAGVWLGPVLAWKMIHNPVFIVNAEGICSQHPFLRTQIKWEEIDSIYRINARNGAVFAVDVSPAGQISLLSRQDGRIPRHLNATGPQMALSLPASNRSIPVDQLLAQIRERFSAQLERYTIDLDDGHEEG